MKTFIRVFLGVFCLIILSCTKEQESLILNDDYLFVADILQYCQGSCDQSYNWENSVVLTKGHIRDIESDSLMDEYFNEGKFYLEDIRNGMFMEIRVIDNKVDIFNTLNSGSKQDMFFLKGFSQAIIAYDENSCTKGVVINLDDPGNIFY